jgi:type I restriction enzyme S subunit
LEGVTFGAFMTIYRTKYWQFFSYFLNSEIFKSQTGLFNTTTINQLTNDTLRSMKVALPNSTEEQQSIVRFLDYKTEQIDSFIANRQKQIELLKEQKQYLLDKKITEGIYPEKGFQKIVHPYIKQIPVGWEFKKLAFLSKITRLAGYEYTLLWEPKEDGEVIALRGQNVGFNELKDIENAERISKELSLRLNRSKLYKGDIVFPCVGTVGKAVLIEEDNKYHINQNIAKITPKNEVDGLFLSLLLNSYYAYHQIIHFNTSDAQPNVLVRDLRRFMIPTPPFEVQKEIARVIVKELDTLNTIISKYQKQIDLMQEYRTSLISQAVTGKIDVRDWQPKIKKNIK